MVVCSRDRADGRCRGTQHDVSWRRRLGDGECHNKRFRFCWRMLKEVGHRGNGDGRANGYPFNTSCHLLPTISCVIFISRMVIQHESCRYRQITLK